MLIIRNKAQVLATAACITLFALGATLLHVQINYVAEMRDLVRMKAAIATVVVAFPISLLVGFQVLRTNRLSQELQRLVDRDRLTDVATRDFFFERIHSFSDAYGASLMVDIDHFKAVNDTHGHLAGDTVIRDVAQVLRAQVREQDIVCRFGGEEFLVFLKQADAQEAAVIAERVRAQIQEAIFVTDTGAFRVTVSVGGSLKDRVDHIDAVIQRADKCLYQAKALGRNRVVLDWDERDRAATPPAHLAQRTG